MNEHLPPECKTEEEKLAYAFGWWKALEVNRQAPLYKEFDDWLDEIEITGTRYDRLLDTFPVQYTDHDMLIKWLRAAWDCARMKNEGTD